MRVLDCEIDQRRYLQEKGDGSVFVSLQVLILEPSKVLQPAILCVSEEDENRTVQLKHITAQKVCRPPGLPRVTCTADRV